MKPLIRIVSLLDFPIAVFIAHAIASIPLKLYLLFPHLDIPFHYLGGFAIAYTVSKVIRYLEEGHRVVDPPNKIVILTLLVSLTATAAVFWEFAEFTIDLLLSTNVQVSLANTMQDQFMGMLGGFTWACIWLGTLMRAHKNETFGKGSGLS